MRNWSVSALVAMFGLAPAGDAQACFREIPVSAQLVADAREFPMLAFPGDANLPPFLIGYLSYLRESIQDLSEDNEFIHGGVLFVQQGGAWTALLPSEGEATIGVYTSTIAPTVIIVSQFQVEAPGQSFTIARSIDGLRTGSCTTIDFPTALNQPTWAMEYLTLTNLQIDAHGRGRLIGSAELDTESDHPRVAWWSYETRDGGAKWSCPRSLAGPPAPRQGVPREVSTPESEAMIDVLTAYARNR
jgi:hypothetical protein